MTAAGRLLQKFQDAGIGELDRQTMSFAADAADFAAGEYERVCALRPEYFGEDADRAATQDDARLRPEALELRRGIIANAVAAGFYGAKMPPEIGGKGLGPLPSLLAQVAISYAPPCPTVLWPDMTGYVLGGAWGPVKALLRGDGAMRERYLAPLMAGTATSCIAITDPEAGSDPQNMRGVAHLEGELWVLDGRKRFVGNGANADFLVTYMRTDGAAGDRTGLSAFVVDADTPGFRVEKILRVMEGVGNHAELTYEACTVPANALLGERGDGFEIAMAEIAESRLHIGACFLGQSEWLLDQAIARAKTRSTFGVRLEQRQAIQWMLADVATAIEQLRWLLYAAIWKLQAGHDVRREVAFVKLLAPSVYGQAADVAIQVHGGVGYLASLPFERAYRRARGFRIVEGTDEMQRRTIAHLLLTDPTSVPARRQPEDRNHD